MVKNSPVIIAPQLVAEHLLQVLSTVKDPEVPVLSILDLGIVRRIEYTSKETIIEITPTYSGCPAMNFIEVNIKSALDLEGFTNSTIKRTLREVWTTDWMSEEGKRKLENYGIAPPIGSPHQKKLFAVEENISCPLCKSKSTVLISQFGSTACKAMYKCDDCLEPFDYFKCI